jgi:hypothetical protein
MHIRATTVFLLSAVIILAARGADEEPAPKTNMREVLRARMAEDAKKQAANPAPANAAAKAAKTEAPETAASALPAPAKPTTAPAPTNDKPGAEKSPTAKSAAQQPATVLPKVEVKKGRITELDQKLAKQDEAIAREKKNTKSSEVDLALNDSKVAKPLSIFGGDSAQFRKRVASERVELMEMEKEIIEAMARTKVKKDRDELQKQLDEIRAMRRDLDKSLR